MKLDGELGFVKPNPPIGDIVSDMGALEQEEKLCCKGVVCDPWNVSDFDHSVSDDSVKDFEEPIDALCTKEKDEFCNATNNVIEYDNNNNNNNIVKDICVDDGVAVTSLGQILFGHKESRTREDTLRVDMETVLEEVVSEGFDFVLAGEDSNIVGKKSVGESKTDNLCNANSKKSAEESKTDNNCSVITNNDEESSTVSYESTEELKTGNAIADNVEESNIVSYVSTEESKTGDATVHTARESNIVSNKIDNLHSAIAVTVEESSIVSNESTGESKTGNAIADNAEESNIVSNKTDNFSNGIVGNVAEPNSVSNKSTEELKIDNLCSVDTESAQNNDYGHFQDLKDGVIHRESSFSIAGPLSGLITYSGPIAYSGSCSLRSDSSTTSTRSFAFPVLQAEWSSSPVRMRAADRRKHRSCWRQGLLCCRF